MDLDQFLATPEIIVGAPGAWPTRADIVQAIAERSGGFLLTGDLLRDVETGEDFPLEVYPHDPKLPRAYALAGRQSLTDADRSALALHTHTLYLIAPGGSQEAARKIMRMASGLLRAGGIAVKVETTGIVHSARDWLALTEHPGAEALYFAFVTLVEKDGDYFSCGMHNLGRPDAIAPPGLEPDEAGDLLEGFLTFLLHADPELAEGHTYQDTAESPRYRLTQEPCAHYPKGLPFHNPYGLWRLTPIE